MPLILTQPPTEEPISLDDAKGFAKIDITDDDLLVQALIVSARMHVEALARRFLVTQNWTFVTDEIPTNRVLTISMIPVQSVTAVRCIDEAGAAIILDPSQWTADTTSSPVRIRFGGTLPPFRPMAGLEIALVAGYGPASAVPEPLRQAIRILVATWYEDRTYSFLGADAGPLPIAAASLIKPFRARTL